MVATFALETVAAVIGDRGIPFAPAADIAGHDGLSTVADSERSRLGDGSGFARPDAPTAEADSTPSLLDT
jgi:hypothetical protein